MKKRNLFRERAPGEEPDRMAAIPEAMNEDESQVESIEGITDDIIDLCVVVEEETISCQGLIEVATDGASSIIIQDEIVTKEAVVEVDDAKSKRDEILAQEDGASSPKKECCAGRCRMGKCFCVLGSCPWRS